MSKDLVQQIDDLVASKTFNLDALDGIKAIKDSLSKTMVEVDYLNKQKGELEKQVKELSRLSESQALIITSLRDKIKANEDTVAKATYHIHEADKHKAVAEAWQGAMAMVFKPNAVRETVARSIPVAVPMNSNGYMGTVNTHPSSETTTREDA